MVDRKQLERTSYLVALRNFARDLGIEEDVALEVYEREMRDLATDPKVTRFIGIIAHKRTRDVLRSRSRKGPALAHS